MDMTIRGIKASSCLHVFQLTPESAASFACWQKKKAEVQLKLSASRCLGGPSMRPHIAARLEVGVISIWVMMVVWWLQSGPFYRHVLPLLRQFLSIAILDQDHRLIFAQELPCLISVRVSWYWPLAFSIGGGLALKRDLLARPLKGRDQSVGRMLLNVSLKQNMSTFVDLWSEASTDRNQKRHCNEDMMEW